MAKISEKQLQVLEKLIGDEEFRKSFFEDSEAALSQAGLELSGEELAGLKKLDQAAVDGFLADVEERLSKTTSGVVVPGQQASSVVFSALSKVWPV
jgi:putative modified peptide